MKKSNLNEIVSPYPVTNTNIRLPVGTVVCPVMYEANAMAYSGNTLLPRWTMGAVGRGAVELTKPVHVSRVIDVPNTRPFSDFVSNRSYRIALFSETIIDWDDQISPKEYIGFVFIDNTR